jgi:hypothetical protein
MNRKSLATFVERDEFKAFKIITLAGLAYEITDPLSLALGEHDLFYYFPKSERSIEVPYSHIATVEHLPPKVKH